VEILEKKTAHHKRHKRKMRIKKKYKNTKGE
jgi:hypothetical protein